MASGAWTLSEREADVLDRRLAQQSFKVIAAVYGVSIGSVCGMTDRTRRELGARSFLALRGRQHAEAARLACPP